MRIDRLHLMNVFVAVAEEGGFSGGARRLGMSPPGATRAIATLEDYLGIKLFNRTTRFVRLTEAGLRYLEDARRVISFADEADEAAIGVNSKPRGHIVVTASVLFGRLFLMPGIVEYLNRYPAMEVSAIFVDRVVNMLEEGVDVAIRVGNLPDSSYKAIRVGSVRRVVCASPDYLTKYGTPQTPEELAKHQFILAKGLNPNSELKFKRKEQLLSIKVKPRLMVSDIDSVIKATKDGLGISLMINYQIADLLANDSLKVILAEYEQDSLPVHIMHSEGRYASTKIRTFVDLIADYLRHNPSLN